MDRWRLGTPIARFFHAFSVVQMWQKANAACLGVRTCLRRGSDRQAQTGSLCIRKVKTLF